MIYQRRLDMFVVQWWPWRTVSLNFHTWTFRYVPEESWFTDYWKFSFLVPLFKNFGRDLEKNITTSYSLLSVVSKGFEKKTCWLPREVTSLFWFLIWSQVFSTNCRSSGKCISIARVFNTSRATRAVGLDIFKAFEKVWNAGLLHKLKC